MRVILEADLFRADAVNDEQHGHLLALFQLGKSNIHSIEVERRGVATFEEWLDKRDLQTRRACTAAIQYGEKLRVRTRMREIYISNILGSSPNTKKLTPVDAYRLLQHPLVVLLEDAMNDRNFLESISRIASNGKRLRNLIDAGHIKIAGFGGVDNNTRWLKDSRRLPDELSRVWVLSDSDAKRPWRERRELLSSAVEKLAEECTARQVPIHVLARRAIENYLPLPALRAWSTLNQSERQEIVDAFSMLSTEQRHHYRMKKGFGNKSGDAETLGCIG